MEAQTNPVSEGIQTAPPHIPTTIGGPSQTMESTTTTMVDDLVRFQSNKSRPYVPENKEEKKEEQAADVTPAGTPQGKDGIFYNGRKYSPEEMTSILRERDEIALKQATVNAVPPVDADEENLEILQYSDPKKYAQVLKEQTKREIRAEQAAIENQKRIKDDFYSNYKDLKGNEDLVELFAFKMQGALAKEPTDVAFLKLAQAVRTRISVLRGDKKATEELSSKPAITAGATGSSSGSAPQPKGPESMSFMDQMKVFQRRGKTKY